MVGRLVIAEGPLSASRVGAQDEGGVMVEDAAVAAAEHEVVLGYLAFAALAAGLHHGFVQRGDAPQVPRRQLPAPGVGRQGSTRAEGAGGHELARLALFHKAVVLEGQKHGEGVAVVELPHVDVVEVDASHLEGDLARNGGPALQTELAARMLE